MVPTRTLTRLHRYLGLLTAPLILFFAISGIWQVFRLHDSKKDGSYTAPQTLQKASNFHMAEDVGDSPAAISFKYAVSVAAGVLVVGVCLGLIVAFRLTRPVWLALLLLLLGTAIPLVLYLIATAKTTAG